MQAPQRGRAAPAATERDPQVDRLVGTIKWSSSTFGETAATAVAHHDRDWWRIETRRVGSDWSGLLALHAAVSQFSTHVHGGGEEFFVLEGVFQDEHGRGLEVLVLEGGFTERGETCGPQSWLRLPIGAHFSAWVATYGCRGWIKEGHLRHVQTVKPKVAWKMLGCSDALGYELLAADELDSFLDGRSRKITVDSIYCYIHRRLKEGWCRRGKGRTVGAAT
jgi:hypothetical protein